jgi:homoserine kinase
VRVPGSSANIGPGFDSIGLALGIWDAYLVALTDAPGLEVVLEGEGEGDIPLDEGHLVHRSMLRAWAALGVHPPEGIRLVCRNTVPQGRGLGSSAAAIVAGVVAAQGLYDAARHGPDHDVEDFDRSFTNDLASAVEGHPDNASASVYGGMTLSWADDAVPGRVHSVQLDVHPDVVPVVLVPATTLPTSTARAVLPERIAHAQAALNSGRSALLVEAVSRRPDLLLPATREWLHQEQRRASFPATMALVDALRARGHAAVVSGAGPSVLVLATTGTAASVRVIVDEHVWHVVEPGMPSTGAGVQRVTLSEQPAETAEDRATSHRLHSPP